MSPLLETLHSGRVLLMDGAMGTELQRAGIGEGECYELWNLTHPEKVQAIHQSYVDAGVDVLLTNTFQANTPAFAKHHLADQIETGIEKAVELARSVAGPSRFVLAAFGPFTPSPKHEEFGQMLNSARGADGWLFETCSDTLNLSVALKCIEERLVTDVPPILFSWTFRRTGEGIVETIWRRSPFLCARRGRNHGIFGLGVNCGRDIGMDEIIEIVRRYRQATDLPLFARPNAGTPTRIGDRWVYPLTPEKMAERLPELLEAGVSMVGGCCGTTSEHIAAMRPIVDGWNEKRGFAV